MGMGGQRHAPAALPPGKRPFTHCIGGWVDPKAGLDGYGKSRPKRDPTPEPSRPMTRTKTAILKRISKVRVCGLEQVTVSRSRQSVEPSRGKADGQQPGRLETAHISKCKQSRCWTSAVVLYRVLSDYIWSWYSGELSDIHCFCFIARNTAADA